MVYADLCSELVLDTVNNDLFLLGSEVLLAENDGYGVDSGRDVVDRDSFISEDLKKCSEEAYLTVHHVLAYRDRAEALVAGDTGNE